MKTHHILSILGAILFTASQVLATPTLWLIGDSTVQVGTPGQQGWGTQLPKFFDTTKIKIENKAKGGRSSRTFRTEGLWDQVLKGIKPGDYVIMQFGHNDAGPGGIGGEFAPGRPARASIKGNGDESQEVDMPGGKKEVVHSYGWYLREFAKEAKEKGATAIILSPIPKRGFVNGKARRDGGGYAGWAREAAQQAGVPFFDLSSAVADAHDATGEEASKALYQDSVHTNPEGAALNAKIVAEGLRQLKDTDIAEYISMITPARSESAPTPAPAAK